MTRYAESTSVPSERSRAEIEKTLTKYGADGFMYGWRDGSAVIAFTMADRQVKFILPMPRRDDPEFRQSPKGRRRTPAQATAAYEQACRQKWRALALVVKAKLEAVESGITVFDDEFMAHIVLPDGQTVGGWMRPQIETAYSNGKMPQLLPSPEGRL